MYLIVGLGNPEEDYSNTRHNMGFDAINKISDYYNIQVNKSKFNGLYGTGMIDNEKIVLLKPQTFMNLSGECIKEFVDYYKVDMNKLIVIYDDIEVEPGTIRIRKKGSAGGHNGMKSVVYMLKTQDFTRIRIGIGKPDNKEDMINYVIGYVSKEDYQILEDGIELAKKATIELLENGIDIAMNKFNSKDKNNLNKL